MWCPKRLETGYFSHCPFLAVGLFLAWEFSLGAEKCQFGGRDDAGKIKLFFLPFLCGYSQVFCSIVLLRFLKWISVVSQAVFVHG